MQLDLQVLKFLENNRISVLGIGQKDNTIHSATLHFAFSKNTFAFYFITESGTRKCSSLLEEDDQSASLVIGFSEEEFSTFQAEGKVRIVSKLSERNAAWNIYATKYQDRAKLKNNEKYVILEFVPSWWRFTDLKQTPSIKISSDQS